MPTATKAKRKAQAPPLDPVTQYATDVAAGLIVAGHLVVLACRRHLADLERDDLHWRPEMAERVIRFFGNVLVLAEGEHAGKPFILEPWQAFVIGSIFGWYGPDGFRRYRTAYIEVGKGNGKSPMAGGVGLYGLVADDEMGAEIYSAAVGRDQARILWRDADNMVSASPYLAEVVTQLVSNLSASETNSYFRPVSSEHRGLDGKRVHMALIDELHEHPSGIVYEKMRAGTKGRRNPLIFEITNSGYDKQSICWQHHEYSEKVLSGALDNDSWFAYVCQLDPCAECAGDGHVMANPGCPDCDDWRDEAVWTKANPNLGVSIQPKYLREQVAEAVGMPAKQNIVLRLNFCIWTQQSVRWLDMESWAAGNTPVDTNELRGRACYAGLDLASTTDICALALFFPPAVDEEIAQVLCHFWVPEEGVPLRASRDRVPYDLWVRQGFITATEGNVTDYEAIRRDVEALAGVYKIKELAVDPWNSTQLIAQFVDDGMPVVEHRQGFASMTAPSKELERLVRGRAIAHGGNPVLSWMASNVAVKQDPAGNIKPDKEKSTERIDGIVALVMACGRASVAVDKPTEISVYVPGEDS